MSSVSQYLDTFKVGLRGRLTALEIGIGPVVTQPLFSNILKEALDKRAGANKDEAVGVEVNALCKTKTIHPQQVLVVRPKNGINTDQATSDSTENKV